MTNAVGPRAVFGVIVPSTNTVVEHDYWRAGIPGVAYRAGSMYIADPNMAGDDGFQDLLVQIRASIDTAVRDALTAEPDRLVMGMSAETFWGGVAGNAEFEQRVRDMTGLEVTTGATAAGEALKAFGAKRIGIVTPYQPVGDEQVVAYFTELGFDVAGIKGLCSASATSIADETPETLREAFLSVDGPDVDALIQCGTNLECIAVAAELEKELGKPVIAINLATMWHAFRVNGIEDRIAGYGSLMELH